MIGDSVCFALVAGGETVGLLGVANRPSISQSERSALAAMAALVALALRNLDVLDDSRRRAIRDALTGCATRAYGLERLQVELRRAYRTGRPVSILLFDIDDFKAVNDTAGHLSGDLVLEGVGRRVVQLVRASDLCCRIGGDEFLVVLPDHPVPRARRSSPRSFASDCPPPPRSLRSPRRFRSAWARRHHGPRRDRWPGARAPGRQGDGPRQTRRPQPHLRRRPTRPRNPPKHT